MLHNRFAYAATLCLYLGLQTSCGYRLLSKVQQAPAAGERIAVLPVVDASHSSFETAKLWKAFQQSIFSSPKLDLVKPGNSQALLQIELLKASTKPSGIVINKDLNAAGVDISENPDSNTAGSTPDFQDFKSLEVAGEYSSDETVSLAVKVKVWNRATKKQIFSKAYRLDESILSTEGLGTEATEYLFYRERAQAELKTLSDRIAQQFVADYLGNLRF